MSFMIKGLGSWLRPLRPFVQSFKQPIVAVQCLNLVRNFANHRHKKVIKLAKGFRGRASRCFTVAFHRVQKARQYAYRDRKVKKREYRIMWIQRINASARLYGMPYATFIHSLNRSNIILNRKVLSELAVSEPLSFKSVIAVAREAHE